jgi:poly(3-hydroxyalkanoate) synthetase
MSSGRLRTSLVDGVYWISCGRLAITMTDLKAFRPGENIASGWTQAATTPGKIVYQNELMLFYNSLDIWQKTAERMLMLRAREADAPKDKRFRHPDWSENAIFDFVKDSYLVAAKSILSAIRGVKGMDEASARRVDFYTRQFVDALSPSNFVTTNPEVLTATLESGGQNLLRGLENLLADLERGNGSRQQQNPR